MVNRARYSADDILDAAAQAVHQHWRSATVAHVTSLLGAPSGSIYHRFATRDALFAQAWVRAVRRFHAGFPPVMQIEDPVEAIVQTGLLIPAFCRDNPVDARMLTVYRYADLVAEPPPGLEADLTDLNTPVKALLAHLTLRRYKRLTPAGRSLVELATRDAPMGMIRSQIGDPIPAGMDIPIRAASQAIAQLDDTWRS
jgi:AcrR family transcriptional regulator